jgi:glucose/arabinose dehydrogenase
VHTSRDPPALRRPGLRVAAVAVAVCVCTGSPTPAAEDTALAIAPYIRHKSALCDGLPPLAVPAGNGLCIGIISARLDFPREVLPLGADDLLITEMRHWVPNVGRLARLTRGPDGWKKTILFQHLDRPHGLARGPDGKIYVGEVGKIFRFSLDRPDREYVINDLPGEGLHPLTQLVFDGNTLLVTVGSRSNNCESEAGHESCKEAQTFGLIRRYVLTSSTPRFTVLSRGLRNTMALAVHTTGTVLGIDNGRDALLINGDLAWEALHPADTLDVLTAGTDFGWPYCYDRQLHAPEFPKHACASFARPAVLLPAHAAPLGMTYWYKGPPSWAGSLVVAFHGYRASGHRLVDFAVDEEGVPKSAPRELTGPWVFPGGRLGSPVDVREGPMGELYITDDRNGLLLKLIADSPDEQIERNHTDNR